MSKFDQIKNMWENNSKDVPHPRPKHPTNTIAPSVPANANATANKAPTVSIPTTPSTVVEDQTQAEPQKPTLHQS